MIRLALLALLLSPLSVPKVAPNGGLGSVRVTGAALGNVVSGFITAGATQAGPFTATFANPQPNGYVCSLNDETNNAVFVIGQTQHTQTSVTFQSYRRTTGAFAAILPGDVVSFLCARN